MSFISDAVTLERLSRILGYKIDKGDFSTTSPNLPMRIAVFGEVNEDFQSSVDFDEPEQITTANKAGELYGYGSPIHMMARILLPEKSAGVGGIPVIVYPQAKAPGAAAKKITITPSGTATGGGTHYVVIAGRDNVDGETYAINIEEGDGPTEITAKISDAVNAVLGAPMTVTDDDYVNTLTSKWKGLTANDLNVVIDTTVAGDLGITYGIASTQNGSGTPDITDALNNIDADWIPIFVNGYGAVNSIMNAFEAWNGIPDPSAPTGRYQGIIMKPAVAFTGTIADDPSSITDGRLNNVTIAMCPAPNSPGMPFEAAANVCVLYAVCAQNTPELDINGRAYPDMPPATALGTMSLYTNRDAIVKKGCSTVTLEAGQYVMQDFVTTYHKTGENPPQFRYVRNLIGVDFNVRYAYYLLEQIHVIDHVIVDDDTPIAVEKYVKPKTWKAVLFDLAEDLAKRGLIDSPSFMKDSIRVGIGTSNPDRLETAFSYKRSGTVRIASTTAKAGFNFGTL